MASQLIDNIETNDMNFKHLETTKDIIISPKNEYGDPQRPDATHTWTAKVSDGTNFVGDYAVKINGTSLIVDSEDFTKLPIGNYELEVWEQWTDPDGTEQLSIYPSPSQTIHFQIYKNIPDQAEKEIKEIGFQDVVDQAVMNIGMNYVFKVNTVGPDDKATVVQAASDGKNYVTFNIPQGKTGERGFRGPAGKAFHIQQTFASVKDMEASQGQGFDDGDFALIASEPGDPDNSKLYVWTADAKKFNYIDDLSGATGIQGPAGPAPTLHITKAVSLPSNQAPTLKLTLVSDSNYNVEVGIPKGEKGDPGKDGYTPVRGTDYWTDADKQAIQNEDKQYIEEALTNLVTQPQLDAFKQTIEKALTKHYNTLADMQKADLKKGQTVTTLGSYAVGDGGAATYLITDTPSDVKLDSGLYAEKIYSGKDNYYDEIEETTKRINNTDVYFVDIPKTDSHGQPITPYIAQNGADRYYNAATKEGGYHDSPTGRDETPTEYARSEHTTLTVNGSASVMVANNAYVNGNIIGNGKILNTWQDQPASVVVPSNFVYVGIMKDRSLREFPFSTTAQQMLDAGVQNSWMSYWRLIRDGNLVDNSNSKGNEGHIKVKDLDPHLGLGIKEDGTLVIAACDGRTDVNSGLTSDDFAQAMKDWGCVNAWHMDGGGSTSVTLRGSKINRNIDDYGVTDRAIPYTFNIKKPGSDTGVAEAFSQAGKAQQETLRQVMPAVHHLDTTTAKWFGQYSFKSDDELDQWLNDSLPDLINWIDYPASGMTSGVIATQYQNSAPGKTVGVVNNADWLATFFVSGSHNWGYLTMTAHWGSDLRTVVRSFGKPLNPKWGNWTPENYPVQITPTKIDPQISICDVFRSGTQVSVDMKMKISGTSGKWIAMIEGLPHPVAASQPFDLTSDDASVARAVIDQGGWIDVKGDAGTYHGHFVYLTNNY